MRNTNRKTKERLTLIFTETSNRKFRSSLFFDGKYT